MDQQQKQNSLKKIIIILLILLLISIVGLAAARIIRNNLDSKPSSVVIPDNIITEESDNDKTEDKTEQEETTDRTEDKVAQTVVSNAAGKDAVVIKLFDRSASDNQPFNVGNMFPGDIITHYYGVQVSYENSVTVHFSTHIRPGYEKLAEVLGCQVVELNTGRVVYDGLMKNMPESLTHQLRANGKTTDVLYYGIAAYLNTSVGNEYQNKTLVADFEWWVEDQQNLRTPPNTGDITDTYLWFAVAAVSLLLVILVFIKKKEEAANENQ